MQAKKNTDQPDQIDNEDIIKTETPEAPELTGSVTEEELPEANGNESDNLKKENEELKDKYLRLYSDFENYKRRTTKERIELFRMAGQEVLKSLIPVLDDFERAEKSFENATEISSISEGLKLVSAKLINTLEQQGLKSYKSIGEKFDSDLHEAITKIPAPSKNLRGKVVDEIEKGYKLQDKVIRFAKVIVGE